MRRTKAEQQMYQTCYAILVVCLFVGAATYYDFDISEGITSFAIVQIGAEADTGAQEEVVEVTQELAIESISQAEADISQMQAEGFKVVYANDLLAEANSALDRADYAELLKTGNFTNPLVKNAKQALEGLDYAGFSYAGVLIYTQNKFQKENNKHILYPILFLC